MLPHEYDPLARKLKHVEKPVGVSDELPATRSQLRIPKNMMTTSERNLINSTVYATSQREPS